MADWLPRLANFAIIVGLLVYFLRKPVRDMFREPIGGDPEGHAGVRRPERAMAALTDMERKARRWRPKRAPDRRSAGRGREGHSSAHRRGQKDRQGHTGADQTGADIEVRRPRPTGRRAAVLAVDLAEGKIKGSITKQDP